MNTLDDVLLDSLADARYAEQQLVKALPKMAKAAKSPELRAAFEAHLEETREHVKKVDRVFAALGEKPKSKKCPAIDGIIEEAEEMIEDNKDSATIDAVLIFAAQKAEHYEISSYGGMRNWAGTLENGEAGTILEEILADEKAADEKLTGLAEDHCNEEALTPEGEGEEKKTLARK